MKDSSLLVLALISVSIGDQIQVPIRIFFKALHGDPFFEIQINKAKTKTKTQSGKPARGARSAPSVGCFTRRVFAFVFALIHV